MLVEVAYALLDTQKIYALDVKEGTTARQAVRLAPVLKDFPQALIEEAELGIFGKVVKDDQQLSQGDRVEIYRPLIADPKEVRKKRAAAGKRMKKGGGEIEQDD